MGNKKSLLQWLTILITVFVLVVIGGCNSNNNEATSKTHTEKTTKTAKKKTKSHKKTKKKSIDPTDDMTEKEKQTYIKRSAVAFGQIDVQTLQRNEGAMVTSNYVDGLGMTYLWKNGKTTYIRVDNTEIGITSVYLYDETAENHLGEDLYQAETIKQMSPRDNYTSNYNE